MKPRFSTLAVFAACLISAAVSAWTALFVADRLRALADAEDEIRDAARRRIAEPPNNSVSFRVNNDATALRDATRIAEHRHHDGGWRRAL